MHSALHALAHRRGSGASFGLVLGLAAALVAACSVAPVTTPPATNRPTLSAEPPASVAPATPEPPAASPPAPVSLTASKIGSFAARGLIPNAEFYRLGGVLPFERGYVAWGSIDSDSIATGYSSDGASWEQTLHSALHVPCPGWVPRADFHTVNAGATVAGTAVLVGSLRMPTATECDPHKLVALATADGTTWQRSAPFGPRTFGPAWASNVWAIPGGLEALVQYVDPEQTDATLINDVRIWRSATGLAWTEVGVMEKSIYGQVQVYGASPDGTRLAVRSDPRAWLASNDGVTWREVTGLPSDFGIVDVIPPGRAGGSWLVSMGSSDSDEARLLSSVDLASWQAVTFPRPAIVSLASTPLGFLAVGLSPQNNVGGCGPPGEPPSDDDCPPPDPALYASPDGLTWTRQFDLTTNDPMIVAGPAGTLLFEYDGEEVIVSRITDQE